MIEAAPVCGRTMKSSMKVQGDLLVVWFVILLKYGIVTAITSDHQQFRVGYPN